MHMQNKFVHNIVLVGVGWSGMSALAGILYDLWYRNVVGIDAAEGEITQNLQRKWIQIIIGHGNYQVDPKDFVIYSDIESIKESPELQQSFRYQQQNLKRYHKPYTYNEFLAELSKHFITIAITWTNGKSSTTALAITALADTDRFWLGIVGALMPDYNNANYVISKENKWEVRDLWDHIIEARVPKQDLVKRMILVLEACEHREHFLLLDVDYAIITNIGYDHQDYYAKEKDYHQAFRKFVSKVKKKVIIENATKESSILNTVWEKCIVATKANQEFLHLFWEHRQINAWLVEYALEQLSESSLYSWHYHHTKWKNFRWLRRRMEPLGIMEAGAHLYSDYGHHPDAIHKALRALKQTFPQKTIVAVIEPHQAQRLLSLWEWFIAALGKADQCIVYPVYHARELRESVRRLPMAQTLWIESFEDVALALTQELWGLYYDDPDSLWDRMNGFDSSHVLVLFSAGILDYQMRSRVKAAS